MALPGETIGRGASPNCSECGRELPIEVLRSAAGYYIGTFCPVDGPYSRESYDYYATREEAEKALQNDTWVPR